MAGKSKDETPEFKRLNRTVGVGEAISGALDPAFRRRGFASRDVVTHWRDIAPAPYDRVAIPDKLTWPRGEKTAQGATLHLRCIAGHQLALVHEAPRIAAAVNRYFGYVLVDDVRLAVAPFVPNAPEPVRDTPPDPVSRVLVANSVAGVSDPNLRAALNQLGLSIRGKTKH